MNFIDYSRSFVTFQVPGNNARIQVEARCVLTAPDGSSQQFLMFASCKSEDTYAEDELFRVPNYDFSGIFGEHDYCIARIHACTDDEQPDVGTIAGRFSGLVRHLCEFPKVTPLTDKASIIRATLDHKVIIGRTELTDGEGTVAVIEYPIKTMNVNPELQMFQTDTGPVPLYSFGSEAPDAMSRFEWAYVAFNDFTGAEFVIQRPTPIMCEGRVIATTTHYSEIRQSDQAVNTLYALED